MPDGDLLAALTQLSAALRDSDVRHAVAGGLALAAWTLPRATVDIDLVIAADAASLERARDACARAGLLQTRRAPIQFRRIAMLRMLVPPDRAPAPIAVDLLLLPDAFQRTVLSRAVSIPLGRTTLPVVSAEDLVLLKLLRCSEPSRADQAAPRRAAAILVP